MNASQLLTVANFARKQFVKAIRPDDSEYWTIKPDAPEWISDMAHAAHGDQLPNDERFAFIVEALEMIQSHDGDREEACSYLEPSIYTQDLLSWVASLTSRYSYCDQAREDGLVSEDASMVDRMRMGMLQEMTETFHAVCEALEEQDAGAIDAA